MDAVQKDIALASVETLIKDMENVDGHVVQGCSKVLGLLAQVNLTYKAQLLPRQVGVHPQNRNGYGLNSENVHALGQDIIRMGFSWDQAEGALAIEEVPGRAVIEDFNRKLAEGNDRLAPVEKDSMKYASVACSHTNALLRALGAGVPKLLALMPDWHKDDLLASAVEKGLTWLVLKHEVAARFPTLPALLQQARNAPGSAARLENEVQIMLKMQQMASAEQMITGASPDYGRIVKLVARSNPPCAVDLEFLIKFVVCCSGGTSGVLLQDLADFHREGIHGDCRTVRGVFYGAVADWDVKAPYLKLAVVKAQYTCPMNRVKHKECLFITAGELASAAKKRKVDIAAAEKVLHKFRAICCGSEWDALSSVAKVRLLAKIDTIIARWLLGKQIEGVDVYTSLGDIIQQVRAWGKSELQFDNTALADYAEGMKPPLVETQASASKQASASTPIAIGVKLQELSESDSQTTLRQHLLEVGMEVSNDKGEVFTIQAVAGENVSFCAAGAGEGAASAATQQVQVDDFVATYKAWTPTAVAHQGWPAKVPSANNAHIANLMKSQAVMALHQASAIFDPPVTSVEVLSKPKAVLASAVFPKASSSWCLPRRN